MIGTTVLATLYLFLDAHKEDIASKVIASASYDVLKKSLNFSSLKKKLTGFFKKDEDSERFMEAICEKKMMTDSAADDEVKQIYESTSGLVYDDKVISFIKEWLLENKSAIQSLNIVTNSNNSGGFNIGSQNAGRNIYNIQGDFKPDKK
ncbi:hypothetical protein [Pedobacter antarcticus]|uniref:hypothetical protein n=1 Tax=Pedobacter antarcticus TaxID=34086 RepID=UPI002931165D|nr:hypothetical protein [Pedobacter antarcticus]